MYRRRRLEDVLNDDESPPETRFIGHVNSTFKHREVTKSNQECLLVCPYNPKHRTAFKDFTKHVGLCPDAESRKDAVEGCEFNLVHYYPDDPSGQERRDHLSVCPNGRMGAVRPRKVRTKPFKKIDWPLPPLMERKGICNPRRPAEPVPTKEEVLGTDIRFPELEAKAAWRRENLEREKLENSSPFEQAMHNVRISGAHYYGSYKQYTSRMSPMQKNQFAKALEKAQNGAWRQDMFICTLKRQEELKKLQEAEELNGALADRLRDEA